MHTHDTVTDITMDRRHAPARTVSRGRMVWIAIVETAFIVNAVSCLIDWGSGRLGTPLMIANVAIAVVTPIVLTICNHRDPPPTWCGQSDEVHSSTTKEIQR